MDRRSPEIIPVLELTSNALLLQAAPSKRRWVIIFKTMLPLIYDYLNCFSPKIIMSLINSPLKYNMEKDHLHLKWINFII